MASKAFFHIKHLTASEIYPIPVPVTHLDIDTLTVKPFILAALNFGEFVHKLILAPLMLAILCAVKFFFHHYHA